MNVTDTKPKPPNLTTTPEAATPGEKTGTTTAPEPQNKLLDAVGPTTPPTASEKTNVLEFYKQAMQPGPKPAAALTNSLPNVPVTNAPGAKNGTAGVALRGALPPNPPNAKALYESAAAGKPNATVGPIAHATGNVDAASISEKDCKMGAELVGELPIVGKPLKNEMEEACKKTDEKSLGPLPNVPITATKGTALGKDDAP